MARPPRIDFPNALYHVTSRGNGRMRIFWTDGDRQRFIDQLADSVHTYDILLYAFVMMDNHYHLLARTPRANLSSFMQRLNTSYALYARYKHQQPGHQFQGRFKAKLVENDSYLRALSRYIHLNPIKIATCQTLSGPALVARLEAYTWSSYPGYVDSSHRIGFVCYDLLGEYGRSIAEAERQYRAYTHACLLNDDGPILDALAASRYAVGSPRFVEETERRLAEQARGRPQDADLDLPRTTMEIARVDEVVTRYYGIAVEQLRERAARVGWPKFVAVELACRLTGLTQRAIGTHYGGITSAAVSNIRRRLRKGEYPLLDVVEHLLSEFR